MAALAVVHNLGHLMDYKVAEMLDMARRTGAEEGNGRSSSHCMVV